MTQPSPRDSDLPPGVRRHLPRLPVLQPVDEPGALAERLTLAARELGFVEIGFTSTEPFDRGGAALRDWLERGHHGEMAYLAGGDRADPKQLLESAQTLIVVALPYENAAEEQHAGDLRGFVARYARGDDYHEVIKGKLRELADRCADALGRPVLARACVDTAPLLEREAAARAGVGFTAKSTLTIVPGVGSYVLLGELLVDVAIAPSAPMAPRCGSCRACLDACPTGAFLGPHQLDARRCISYLTIELAGAIPRELRAPVGRRVFGCDICQEVCPFNASKRPRPSAAELRPRAELQTPDLIELLELTSSGYKRLVKGSALRRVSRARLARNAAVALGNSRDPRAVAPLARALQGHASELVRSHAAWALGELGRTTALGPVERAQAQAALSGAATDPNEAVRAEAHLALSGERSTHG